MNDSRRMVAVAPDDASFMRLFYAVRAEATMQKRVDSRSAEFSVPGSRMTWFLGHCERYGITCHDVDAEGTL